jgi:hypothetical protein
MEKIPKPLPFWTSSQGGGTSNQKDVLYAIIGASLETSQ